MPLLTKEEERVLGALIEKKHTTPEYYPLTLNSLRSACNQKSNRDPVVTYSEEDIEIVLDSLFEKKLVFKVSGAGQRVTKYNENFANNFNFSDQQTAVMCVLMLRGAQTIGEIRGRSARIYDFNDLGEVEETLQSLINFDSADKLVVKLPRSTGRDPRYASVLSGEPELKEENKSADVSGSGIDELKDELLRLKTSLEEFKEEFEKFRKQFE